MPLAGLVLAPSGDILSSVLRISLRRPKNFSAPSAIGFFFFIFALDITERSDH